jgi:hypothetical protein
MSAAFALGAAMWMLPGTASAYFSAPLVECQAVTSPAALSGCGTDPMTSGSASIDDEGDLDIALSGAAASVTYTVALVGPGGSFALPDLKTGPQGNGVLSKEVFFSLGKIGAGNIVLSRDNSTQFVTGIAIEQSGGNHSRDDFRPELVSCSAVNVGTPITGCGSDAFKNGQVSVASDNGDVNVQVEGAAASVTYAVVLRSGASDLTLCSAGLPTDSKGDGQCMSSGLFAAGTIGSGTVVLTRSISGTVTDEAYSGFRVSLKPRPKPAAVSGLVRCADVTYGLGGNSLSGCGSDPLSSGSAVLGNKGVLTVDLTGAAPTTTYEVFFRPVDSTGSTDTDTTIAITTDSTGSGKGSKTIAPSGTVGSGNFVVKSGGDDEFLTGFTVPK